MTMVLVRVTVVLVAGCLLSLKIGFPKKLEGFIDRGLILLMVSSLEGFSASLFLRLKPFCCHQGRIIKDTNAIVTKKINLYDPIIVEHR